MEVFLCVGEMAVWIYNGVELVLRGFGELANFSGISNFSRVDVYFVKDFIIKLPWWFVCWDTNDLLLWRPWKTDLTE